MTINLNSDDKEIKIEAPLFILFGEYLGYISDYNKIAKNGVRVKYLIHMYRSCLFLRQNVCLDR